MSGHIALVLDDEESMRDICGRVLRSVGLEPLFAGTLGEALGKLDGLERLDVLVADLRLPDGDGLEAARAARKKFPQAGIVFVTASLGEGKALELAAIAAGEDGVLLKPFFVDRLEAAVRRRLNWV